ncbi:MAG TPA: phytanoyl-CoA dioxygenase family protein [Chitinophagaceae bacterium]|nr:phytanoyl-CoA dioxygenase family protein [Chitinophagaceae bacterium]
MKKNELPVFEFGDTLTDSQLQFFQKNGAIHFRNFLNKETVANFVSEIDRVQAYLLENDILKINGVPLKLGTDVNGDPLIQRIAFATNYSSLFKDFLQDERLKRLVELMKPYEGRIAEDEKDGMVINHYINTSSSKCRQLGWHTDAPRDLFLGSKILPMLNVGIHLDDCPFNNGGLRILSGTHRQSLFNLLFRKKYFIGNKPDRREVGVEIQAGDLTVHDGRLWHRVQQSPFQGEASRRRVIYIPIITGAYRPKHANSPTALYHKLGKLKLNPNGTGATAVNSKKKSDVQV